MTVSTIAPQSAATARRLKTLSRLAFAGCTHPRQSQRAEDYLRGLLAQPERKTVSAIAAAAGCCKQSLQHFITDSPWDLEPVRAFAAHELERSIGRSQAWIIDDTGQAKQGQHSPGVQRQYSGTLGRVGNCQIAVSLNLAGESGSGPANWRLFMPESWERTRRRKPARVPPGVRHAPKGRLALEMMEEALAWGLRPQPVLADEGYGKNHEFRAGIKALGLSYMVEVGGALAAHPEHIRPAKLPVKATGRPTLPRIRERPRSMASLARGHALRKVPGQRGSFLALRVRPATRGACDSDGQLEACWLVLWRRPSGQRKYLLCNLPEGSSLKTLARLASLRWRIECDYREDKQCLGLAHFEGRTLAGWERHVTLCGLARLLVLAQRLSAQDASFYMALRAIRPSVIELIGRCPTCGCHSPPQILTRKAAALSREVTK